jgi:hypothetical protein
MIDVWLSDADMKDFTVLFQDGRTAAVRGHALKHLPATSAPERDSWGIVVRSADREDLIAVFKVSDVSAIFHGELRVAPTAA